MTTGNNRSKKMQRVAVSRIDFYHDDWLTGTDEMSLELRGAYITICARIWSKEGALCDDDFVIAGWCRCSTRKWRLLKQQLIDAGKIEVRDGFIYQERAESELFNALSQKDMRIERASSGGRIKAEKRRKLLERYNSESATSTATSTAQAYAQEEKNTGKNPAQNVLRARVPSPSPLTPLNPPEGNLSDFEENQAELIWQAVERFIDARWPDDPTPRSGNAFDVLHESCRALAGDGVTVGVFEHLMAPEFRPGRISKIPLHGLGAWRERLIKNLRHWIEMKRGRAWAGLGPEPSREAMAAFSVPAKYFDPSRDAPPPALVEPDDAMPEPPAEPKLIRERQVDAGTGVKTCQEGHRERAGCASRASVATDTGQGAQGSPRGSTRVSGITREREKTG